MTTKEKLMTIINNDNIVNTFGYLYERWQDEKEYEDINHYGITIVSTINKEMPSLKAACIRATKKPFGVKIYVDGILFHFYVKASKQYLSIRVKEA